MLTGCLELFRFGFIWIRVFLAVTVCSYSQAMVSKVLSNVLHPGRARTLTDLQALHDLHPHLSFSIALSHSISTRPYRVSVCTCAALPWATDSWCIHTWTPGLLPTPPRADALPVPCLRFPVTPAAWSLDFRLLRSERSDALFVSTFPALY